MEDAAHDQNRDRRQILQYGPDGGGGVLDAVEVEQLARSDSRYAVDQKQYGVGAASPRVEGFGAFAGKIKDQEYYAGDAEPDRDEPLRVHALICEQILADGAGAAPADAGKRCEQRAFQSFAHLTREPFVVSAAGSPAPAVGEPFIRGSHDKMVTVFAGFRKWRTSRGGVVY